MVDQVLPGTTHVVAIGLEGGIERRRVVALDAGDDLGLRRGGIDLTRGRGPIGMVTLQLLPADLEDRVGIEAIERAQPQELVVALATDRPIGSRAGQDLEQPLGLVLDGDLGAVDGAAEATAIRRRHVGAMHLGRGDDLVQEARHVPAGVELDLQPRRDLGPDGTTAIGGEESGRRFEPGGDRPESLGKRREVAREEREQGIPEG